MVMSKSISVYKEESSTLFDSKTGGILCYNQTGDRINKSFTYLSARYDDVLTSVQNSDAAIWIHDCKVARFEIPTTKSFTSSLRVTEILERYLMNPVETLIAKRTSFMTILPLVTISPMVLPSRGTSRRTGFFSSSGTAKTTRTPWAVANACPWRAIKRARSAKGKDFQVGWS